MGRVLLALEAVHEEAIKQRLEPETKTVELTETEKTAAIELLRDSKLIGHIPWRSLVQAPAPGPPCRQRRRQTERGDADGRAVISR